MQNRTSCSYDPAEVRARERRRVRERNGLIVRATIAGLIVGGNVALYVYRDQVISWARATFGQVEITIDKARPEEP